MRVGNLVLLGIVAVVLLSGCTAAGTASGTARAWQPGERIICPRCAQEFVVPEKLGTDR